MSWTKVWKYYGLQAPYNFRVAIPFLLSALLLLMVLLASVFMFLNGNLSLGTARFVFFAYTLLLLCAAAAFSRVTSISVGILLWCTAELSLALFERHGTSSPLFPNDLFTVGFPPQFAYHPILGIVPKPNWHGEWHTDRRNKRVLNRLLGDTINEGTFFAYRIFTHNSLGLRGMELSEDDRRKDLIFVYGGSTTYDFYATQGSTWPERLEVELNSRFTIVNFGVPSHTTAQHLIYTAFYQNELNKKPICAIYYIGYNDLFNLHIKHLDPAYANHSALLSIVRRPEFFAVAYSPALRLIYTGVSRRLDTAPLTLTVRDKRSATDRDIRLEQIFAEHISTISAINNSRGIKSIFVGQILNKEILSRNPNNNLPLWPEFVRHRDALPTMEHFNSVLKSTSNSVGANYIDAGVDNFNNNDFADELHFSAAGSSRFAKLISDEIESYCQ